MTCRTWHTSPGLHEVSIMADRTFFYCGAGKLQTPPSGVCLFDSCQPRDTHASHGLCVSLS